MTKAWWQPKERQALRLGSVKVSTGFEPRDIWIGVFWDKREGLTQVFVTIVPCFPVRFAWGAHEVVTVGHDPDGGDVWICVACGCDVAGDME